jgi:hypothetical protein
VAYSLDPLRHHVAPRVAAELEHDHELDHPMTRLRVLDGRRQSGRVHRLERREVGVDVEVPVEERTDDVHLLLGGTPVDARDAEQAARDRLGEFLVHGSHAFLLPSRSREATIVVDGGSGGKAARVAQPSLGRKRSSTWIMSTSNRTA